MDTNINTNTNPSSLSVDPKFVVEQYRVRANEIHEQLMFALAMVNQLNQKLNDTSQLQTELQSHIVELENKLQETGYELDQYKQREAQQNQQQR